MISALEIVACCFGSSTTRSDLWQRGLTCSVRAFEPVNLPIDIFGFHTWLRILRLQLSTMISSSMMIMYVRSAKKLYDFLKDSLLNAWNDASKLSPRLFSNSCHKTIITETELRNKGDMYLQCNATIRIRIHDGNTNILRFLYTQCRPKTSWPCQE